VSAFAIQARSMDAETEAFAVSDFIVLEADADGQVNVAPL
jgi:hypothetical protein